MLQIRLIPPLPLAVWLATDEWYANMQMKSVLPPTEILSLYYWFKKSDVS